MKTTIALIYGGEGKEHNISILSAKNLSPMIDRLIYRVIHVLITEKGEWFIELNDKKYPTFPIYLDGKSGLFLDGRIITVDLAIPILHGEMGEDGVIVGALNTAHIKTLGCPTLAGAVTSDKITTKFLANALNIPTAKWIFCDCEECDAALKKAESALSYPMFIKPSSLGSSIGISRVTCRCEFESAYENARKLCQRILIEEAIAIHKELECAYLFSDNLHRYEVGEVCADGQFYDFEKKYEKDTKTLVFDGKTDIKEKIVAYSDSLREAIGIRALSRFDFFLTKNSEIYFNEINALPGMTKTSLYPILTEKMGFDKGEFINILISEALL